MHPHCVCLCVHVYLKYLQKNVLSILSILRYFKYILSNVYNDLMICLSPRGPPQVNKEEGLRVSIALATGHELRRPHRNVASFMRKAVGKWREWPSGEGKWPVSTRKNHLRWRCCNSTDSLLCSWFEILPLTQTGFRGCKGVVGQIVRYKKSWSLYHRFVFSPPKNTLSTIATWGSK